MQVVSIWEIPLFNSVILVIHCLRRSRILTGDEQKCGLGGVAGGDLIDQ